MHPPTPEQRIHRWHTFLVVWAVHRVLGLGFGALLVLSSTTGSLLVVHDDLERLLAPGRHVIETSPESERLPIAPLVRAIAAEAPDDYRPLRLVFGREPSEADQLLFVAPDGRTRWTALLNPRTGAVLWRGPDQSLLTPWLLGLHMHLRIGGWGYVITGAAGAGLLLLGLTGLYIHRERLSALWRAPMRIGRGWRVALSDLHKWIGVVSIYFSLVLGLTGAIYAVKIAPGQIAAAKPIPPPFDLAQLAPVEPMLAAARAHFPEAELLRVAFPISANAPVTLLALHRDAPVWRKFSRIEFDPASGATRRVHHSDTATPWEQFSSMLAPLHFGFYGARWVKWAYFAGGLAPALLALSGAGIWWHRRRRTPTAVELAPRAGRSASRR